MNSPKPPICDTAEDTVLMLSHIPKTAGSTFLRIVQRQFSSDELFTVYPPVDPNWQQGLQDHASKGRLRAVMGHLKFGNQCWLGERPFSYFTFLRDPVRRVISNWNHVLNGEEEMARRVLAEAKTLAGFATHDWGRNVQAYYVAGATPEKFHRDPEKYLQVAKENLSRHFIGVGITERFDESLLFLRHALNWRRIGYHSTNLSSRRAQYVRLEDVPADVVALIRDNNRYDQAIYEHANELFDAQLATIPDLPEQLARFRRLNRVVYSPLALLRGLPRRLHRACGESVRAVARAVRQRA